MQPRRMLKLACLAFLAVTASIVIEMPWIFAHAYHLLHGDTVMIPVARVQVPRNFWVSRDGLSAASASAGPTHDLTLFSRSGFNPFRRLSWCVISFFELPSGHPFEPDSHSKLVDTTIEQAAREGFALSGNRSASVSGSPTHCYEFAAATKGGETLYRCFVDGSTLVIYFQGTPQYKAIFFSVLDGIELRPANAAK